MEDKQKIANDALSETINSGVLSFVKSEIPQFVDLPEMTSTNAETQNQSVSNNFNVNVNLSNNSTTSSSSNISGTPQSTLRNESNSQNNPAFIKTAATNAMRNALPTLTGSPEEIKKNSSTILHESSNQILNETQNKVYENLISSLMVDNTLSTSNETEIQIGRAHV